MLPLEPKDKTKTEKPEKHDPVEPGEKKPGSEHNVPPSTSGEGKPGSENDDPPTIPGEGAPGGNENGGRPEDVLLGRRMVAQWRAESGYKELFDLDGLFIRREKEKFDAAYMNRFVLFASSAAEGKGRYLLTDRDMDKLQILDIRFDAPANTITFWTSYNGIKSDAPMALGFSKELYYAAKLTVNRNRTADLYLHGVANNLSLFLNSLLEYDTERYAVIAEGYSSAGGETIHAQMKLVSREVSDMELATITKTISGFKSLNRLAQELEVKQSSELRNRVLRYIKDDKVETERLKSTIRSWITTADFAIHRRNERIPLTWDAQEDLLCVDATKAQADLFFKDPRFRLESARLQQNDLILTLRMLSVNGEALDDILFPLTVRVK